LIFSMLVFPMKTAIKIIAGLLLLFNGTGAIYGGWNLIVDTDGSSIGLSSALLEHSPFDSYLLPGIVLFIANGLFSLFVFAAMIKNLQKYPMLIIAQGIILTGWIEIQMLMIQTVHFLHYILEAVGLLLIICGWMLILTDTKKTENR
jgi:hypothetical protein